MEARWEIKCGGFNRAFGGALTVGSYVLLPNGNVKLTDIVHELKINHIDKEYFLQY